MSAIVARRGIVFAALVVSTLGLAIAQGKDKAAAANPTLEGATLGTHVLGPEVKVEDLKGKVVVFEYWGDKCPPCIASIPHLVELQDKYGRDKVIFVANQVWTQDVEAAKKAWTAKTDKTNVSVVNHGGLKDVQVRGVPHAFVFDAQGNFVWRGHPMQNLGEQIDKALAAAPAPAQASAE